ncbi:hypothetical protein AB4Z50_35805 [Paenibacillus sp. 2TAB26]|uniref:hypothetical protein n=1 Tax=Paenibacillus sp. 2TAB26 TaxID=3233005 RepID=UPI003F9C8C90
MMNLRYLTRQFNSLTDMYVQAQLQFQAVLDQVFPEYRSVFRDLYSKVSLRFLALHPTSSAVLTKSLNDITVTIQSLTGRSNSVWALEVRAEINNCCGAKPFQGNCFFKPSHLAGADH